ncbi:MAG: hypothetical protein ABSA69_04485 [Verrucomicrobiota bacterium]
MNEPKKEITREQLYEEVWRTPLTKLAADMRKVWRAQRMDNPGRWVRFATN